MIFIARTSGISFQENLQFVLVSFKNDSKHQVLTLNSDNEK